MIMTDKKDEWGNIELPGLSDDKLLNTNWNRVTGARQAVKIRETTGWKEKNEKRYEDPEYVQRVAKSISETYSTPEGRQKQSAKQHAQKEETKQKIRQANLGKNRKGQDWIAAMKAKKLGQPGKRVTPVVTPHGAFRSKRDAAEFYINNKLTTRSTLVSCICWLDTRIKQTDSGIKFITKEEYIILTGKDI